MYLLSFFDVTNMEFGMQGGNVCTAGEVFLQISVCCHFTMIPIQEARQTSEVKSEVPPYKKKIFKTCLQSFIGI